MMNINVQKMTSEDKNQFAQLYKQYYSPLYHYVYSSIKNEHIANDITSEVFALACEAFEQIKTHPNQAGWLYKTARNKIKEFFRKMKDAPLSLDENSSLIEQYCYSSNYSSVYSIKELKLTLHDSLAPAEYKRFLRYFIWGYSIQEIAELEGISCNNVSVRLSRLRQKIKEYL